MEGLLSTGPTPPSFCMASASYDRRTYTVLVIAKLIANNSFGWFYCTLIVRLDCSQSARYDWIARILLVMTIFELWLNGFHNNTYG